MYLNIQATKWTLLGRAWHINVGLEAINVVDVVLAAPELHYLGFFLEGLHAYWALARLAEHEAGVRYALHRFH